MAEVKRVKGLRVGDRKFIGLDEVIKLSICGKLESMEGRVADIKVLHQSILIDSSMKNYSRQKWVGIKRIVSVLYNNIDYSNVRAVYAVKHDDKIMFIGDKIGIKLLKTAGCLRKIKLEDIEARLLEINNNSIKIRTTDGTTANIAYSIIKEAMSLE